MRGELRSLSKKRGKRLWNQPTVNEFERGRARPIQQKLAFAWINPALSFVMSLSPSPTLNSVKDCFGCHQWNRVDWTRSSTESAEQLGVAVSQVSRARRSYAPETLKARARPLPPPSGAITPEKPGRQVTSGILSGRIAPAHLPLTGGQPEATAL